MPALLFPALLAAIALLCGAAALSVFRTPAITRLERLWLASGLGFGMLSLAAFFLGIAGGFRPLTAGIFLAAVAVLAAVVLWVNRRNEAPADSPSSRTWPHPLWLLSGLLLILNLLAAMTPEVRADPLTYHLALAAVYAGSGGLVEQPWHAFHYFPSNQEMLYTLALVFANDTAAKLVQWWQSALLLAGMGLFSWRFFGEGRARTVAALAGALFMLNHWTAYLSTTCYIDAALALYELLAVYCIIRALSANGQAWWILGGAFAGFALGCKYVALPLFLAPLALAVLVQLITTRRRDLLRGAATSLAVALLLAAPWFVRNAILTGNPLFPLLTEIFGPAGPLVDEMHRFFDEATRPPAWAFASVGGFINWIGLRCNYLATNGGAFPFLAAAIVALGALIRGGAAAQSAGAARFVLVYLALVFAAFLIASTEAGGRFLYPAYAVVTPLLAAILIQSCEAMRARGLNVVTAVLIPLVLVCLLGEFASRRINSLRDLDESAWPVLGESARTRYLQERLTGYSDGAPLAAVLAPGERILGGMYTATLPWMAWQHGWKNVIADGMPAQTEEALAASLRANRIAFVVFPNGYPVDQTLLRQLVERDGRLLYSEDGSDYYIMRWAAGYDAPQLHAAPNVKK